MKRERMTYITINLAVAVITLGIFLSAYGNPASVFEGRDIRYSLVLVAGASMVHLLKAGRLYLALYGTGIPFAAYVRMYCRTAAVSMVLPFKLGEFFRMYCCGRQLGSLLKGAVIILLDRFMDTMALAAVIFLVWAFNGGAMTLFTYLLLIFLVFLVLLYCGFPGVYQFWNRYLLRAEATEKRLAMLKLLKRADLVYEEIRNVSRGRGLILCAMSLSAWAAEIGSLALLNGLSGEGELGRMVSVYLVSAVGTGESGELRQFVAVSVMLIILVYLGIKGTEMLRGRKARG